MINNSIDQSNNDNKIMIDIEIYRQFCIICLLWYFNFILETNKFMLYYNSNIDDTDNKNCSINNDFNDEENDHNFNLNSNHDDARNHKNHHISDLHHENHHYQQQQQYHYHHHENNFSSYHLSLEELHTLQYHFYLYDTCLNGYINTCDVHSLLQDIVDFNNNNDNTHDNHDDDDDDHNTLNNFNSCNSNYTDEEIELILHQLDPHHSHIIFFTTFLQWWCN
jgi:hypothetical protein